MENSEERREIAAKLRDASELPEENIIAELVDICGISFGGNVTLWRATMTKLADLIDPRCDIATDQVDDGEWGAHEIYECCSNCGNQNMRDRFTGKPYRYCPNCGARVMRPQGPKDDR